jgi:hypothetical protein
MEAIGRELRSRLVGIGGVDPELVFVSARRDHLLRDAIICSRARRERKILLFVLPPGTAAGENSQLVFAGNCEQLRATGRLIPVPGVMVTV